ncbi:hypothetical protein GCM10008910_43160 [Faecalicatena orotica]|uniref:Uncharacterized protein n=1 Tax=Faecalicatena orotica TaxID=1544 RepID=A0A2Y9BNU7_9FIRM|nr:DUF6019 family protein [Faecalicatena orotica]PWJ23090.1 hypothetical protein A8806_11524 [Faecalicatena orotica]SSA57826.1 hypothetical protein SAMN05216536_11524 [Faecalicatena orotica]
MMYMFGMLYHILAFAFVVVIVGGLFVLLYFVVKKAVRDGMMEANAELHKGPQQSANERNTDYRTAKEKAAEQKREGL